MDLCRICLFKAEPNNNIFNVAKNGQQIAEILRNFASVEIEERDDLPVLVCSICEEKVDSLIDFQTLIRDSNAKLQTQEFAFTNVAESAVEVIVKEEPTDDETNAGRVELPATANEYPYDDQAFATDTRKVKKRIRIRERKIPCPGCDRAFRCNSELVAHTATHTGNEPYRCGICKKGFIFQTALKAHMFCHSTDRAFECKECGKAFKHSSALNSHRIRCHSDPRTVTGYTCEHCGKSFSFRSDLRLHLAIHANDKPLMCEKCGKAFSHPTFLSRHLKTHTKRPRVPCPVCGKFLADKHYLSLHLATVHSSEQRYSCAICHNRFKHRVSLNNHMKIHSGVKDYSCKICEKRFTFSSVLYRHMRVHSGETPYECDFCDRRFPYKHHMLSHVKKHHADGVSFNVGENK